MLGVSSEVIVICQDICSQLVIFVKKIYFHPYEYNDETYYEYKFCANIGPSLYVNVIYSIIISNQSNVNNFDYPIRIIKIFTSSKVLFM